MFFFEHNGVLCGVQKNPTQNQLPIFDFFFFSLFLEENRTDPKDAPKNSLVSGNVR